MRLGEEISRLMKSGHSMKKDSVLTKTSPDKMAVNFIMFGAFMKDIVVSNLASTCTVRVKGRWSTKENPHIGK